MCIAVMLPCFQSSGRLSSSGDLRSRMSNGGVSASATSLSTHGCPGDLLGFSFINLFLMISSVRVISSRGVSLDMIRCGLQNGGVIMIFPCEYATEEGI